MHTYIIYLNLVDALIVHMSYMLAYILSIGGNWTPNPGYGNRPV